MVILNIAFLIIFSSFVSSMSTLDRASFANQPTNVAAFINTPVTLTCSVNQPDQKLEWHFTPLGGSETRICDGSECSEKYFIKKSAFTGDYDLIIGSIQSTNAGLYTCRLNNIHFSSHVVAVTSQPNCSNSQTVGIIEGDLVPVYCSISYYGSLVANFSLFDIFGNSVASTIRNNVDLSTRAVTSIARAMLTANISMPFKTYTWVIMFMEPNTTDSRISKSIPTFLRNCSLDNLYIAPSGLTSWSTNQNLHIFDFRPTTAESLQLHLDHSSEQVKIIAVFIALFFLILCILGTVVAYQCYVIRNHHPIIAKDRGEHGMLQNDQTANVQPISTSRPRHSFQNERSIASVAETAPLLTTEHAESVEVDGEGRENYHDLEDWIKGLADTFDSECQKLADRISANESLEFQCKELDERVAEAQSSIKGLKINYEDLQSLFDKLSSLVAVFDRFLLAIKQPHLQDITAVTSHDTAEKINTEEVEKLPTEVDDSFEPLLLEPTSKIASGLRSQSSELTESDTTDSSVESPDASALETPELERPSSQNTVKETQLAHDDSGIPTMQLIEEPEMKSISSQKSDVKTPDEERAETIDRIEKLERLLDKTIDQLKSIPNASTESDRDVIRSQESLIDRLSTEIKEFKNALRFSITTERC